MELLAIVLGRIPEVNPAQLGGCRSVWVAGRDFPMIYRDDSGVADGILLEASDEDVARMDFYEGPFSYDLAQVTVECDGASQKAYTYFPAPGLYQPGASWTINDWTRVHGALRKQAAAEIMERFGVMSAQEVAARYPVIQARAQQRLNAMTSEPERTLRANSDPQRVEIIETSRRHDDWFMTEEITLSHPRFDGTQSARIKREVFVMADAVTVLPYDPVQDSVLLIEQFRAGVHRRGDPFPWSLEVIAGRIDGGETAHDAAIREAREETGLSIQDLVRANGFYSSPGATTEYLTSFIALCDLSEFQAGTGGLLSEDEDIRSMVVSFDTLMEAVASGEAENAPLLVSALWLQANRSRLRCDG